MFIDSLFSAASMLIHGHNEVWSIVWLSLRCTFAACIIAGIAGVPCALLLSKKCFWGRRGILVVLNSLQAIPTVVVGLLLYMFIARQGVFGSLALLYTPTAIILGQAVLIFPLVTMLALGAISRLDTRYRQMALTLGATELQASFVVLREARFALGITMCAAFGRGIGEVGVSMMLGGNIKGFTRTMTTAMALEYDKGEFTLALALGIALLFVSLVLNASLNAMQGWTEPVQ